MRNPFSTLTKFEWALLTTSATVVTLAFCLGDRQGGILSYLASLIGVVALIFLAKGNVLGHFLIILFSSLYGIVSYSQHYYGELLTYVGMSAPMALFSILGWLRHPYQGKKDEVQIHKVSRREWLLLPLCTLFVTVLFYFLLRALHTAQLAVSTLSVTTSFLAASLTFLRSPWYAFAYAVNDLVLIVLWIIASQKDPSCLSMLACFCVFFVNDLYGFLSWRKRARLQAKEAQSLDFC